MYARDNRAIATVPQQQGSSRTGPSGAGPSEPEPSRAGPVPAGPPAPALPPDAEVEVAVTALRMLADGTRLRLMWVLRDGEHDVSSLAARVGAARPAVSQHLAKLLLAGLVSTRRDGRRALYTARGGHVRRLVTEVVHAANHQVSGEPDHD